LLPLLGAL